MSPGAIAGGIIGIVVLLFLVGYYANKRRREGMAALAESLGFTFSREPGVFVLPAVADFELGSHGDSKKGRNAMTGRNGDIDVTIFDYQYSTGSGKNRSTHVQTVGMFKSESLQLPKFVVRPEHVFHKIGSVFGYQDIDFDRYPEFSKKYLLRSEDEDTCRALFTDEVLRYFEGQKRVSVEGNGKTILFYRPSRTVKVKDIQQFLQDGFGVFALFRGGS
jgi:hypothetical protein